MMAKIVHVISGLGVGGAELMLKRLVIESLKSSSHKYSVISLTTEGEGAAELVSQGIEVRSLGMRSGFGGPIALYKLIKIFKRDRPDVVYTWMYYSDLLGGLAAFFCGIKDIIWGIRCTQIPQRSFSVAGLIRKICSVLSFYLPRKIICCAEAARLAHVDLGYCAEKMIVIPNGFDLSVFKPSAALRNKTRKKLNVSERSLVVGIVGRFDPMKDFNNFIQAASLVSDELNDVKFLMIGRGLDKENTELMQWIEKTQCPNKFILIGETDPHDLYAAMDLYCLSSKGEGFPNVVAEAMAMGIPCVVTDVGDAALIVGTSGLVVDPMDAYALYKGLISMLTLRSQELQLFGATARQLIENHYDIKVVQKKFSALVRPR
jgi:glycosyltransferase involved in cell wall biosynthesis